MLLLVILFAFFLRIVNISNNPPSLYGDELTLVYDGYSILKTGMDQTGKFLPLSFEMSEGRPPGYVYFSLPFIALFGPNELSARLLSVISGVGIVFLIYLITKIYFGQKTALIAAFFVSILPWDINLSRGGFETHFALFLTLWGVYLFIRDDKLWSKLFSGLFLGLAIFTYHSYKVVVPLVVLSLALYKYRTFKEIFSKKLLAFYVVLGLFIILWISQILNGEEVRFKNTNLFSDPKIQGEITRKINLDRSNSLLPEKLNVLFHNKFVENYYLVLGNYWSNYSLDFIAMSGDRNPRHNPTTMGGFYLVQIILFLIGLYFVFRKSIRLGLLLISWIIISPIAGSVVSSAHNLRSSFLYVPLIIFSSVGLYGILNKKNVYLNILAVTLILGIFIQFMFFADRMYFLSENQFGNFWSKTAKDVSLYVREHKDQYDHIIVSDKIDSIELAYQVYNQVDPGLVIKHRQNTEERKLLNNLSFKEYDKVLIGKVPESEINKVLGSLEGKVLYIGNNSDRQYINNYKIIKDDKQTFLVVEKTD